MSSWSGGSIRHQIDNVFAICEHALRDNDMLIEWTTKAVKDMRRLAIRDRERIIAKIEQYAKNPVLLANQVIRLTGSEYRRMRVGHYRVIFKIEHHTIAIMVILRVRHRREAYD